MNRQFGDQFRNRRVLITGHTGFKGSWLSVWLTELGAKVIGYSLDPPTEPNNFQLCKLQERLIHHSGDVRDVENLTKVIRSSKPEIVFHMAAQPIVLDSYRAPKDTFDTNVMGTVNLFEAVRQTETVKAVVVVTTDKVYADQGWYWGYRENDRLGGFDPYSSSKAMAELAVSSYRSAWREAWHEGNDRITFSNHPVAIASARAGNVIGGGDFARFRLLPDCMRACMEGQPVQVRRPESIRPWQHLLEPLSGYLCLALRLLEDPETFGQAWNFGPAERQPVTSRAVIEKAIEYWGGGRFETGTQPDDGHETPVLRVNWDQAAHLLSWSPAYTWENAVNETVTWWKLYKTMIEKDDSSVDMYQVCADHIEEYVECARNQGIEWASGGSFK
ncbi:CDP-glucose 4,6-dehydratase [Marinobacter sp. TBZ242]|uniref:CDP-glucose 4,6-dehydratase n=1 Tax=Marinobacter azerbaijanicus TaxID=3050455 RepID=A0ABT7I7V3_9GAMM|nr:CDP-glucose 4,6-dehydratase [Marinobacter sp. TBZ242]MDL0429763.1 CDP-glucose 4,6-dehydratase [Marinobacter sp. TBZ242]